jgi:hypothetical protein
MKERNTFLRVYSIHIFLMFNLSYCCNLSECHKKFLCLLDQNFIIKSYSFYGLTYQLARNVNTFWLSPSVVFFIGHYWAK